MPFSKSRSRSFYLSNQKKWAAFSFLFRLLVPTVPKPQVLGRGERRDTFGIAQYDSLVLTFSSENKSTPKALVNSIIHRMREALTGKMGVHIRETAHAQDTASIITRKTPRSFSRVPNDQKLALAQSTVTEFFGPAHHPDTTRHPAETQGWTEFVLQSLDYLKCGNSYVIFVNQDWHGFSGTFHPVHEALLASKRTKVVALEYFNPELYVNAGKVPLLGRLARWLWDKRYYQQSDRICYAKALERACEKYGKPIAVADIAHTPYYSLHFYLCYLVAIVGGSASLLNLLPDHKAALVPALLFLYHRLDTGMRRLGKKIGRKLSLGGMFDPACVHWYETFFLDLEDGRRILGTCGARQLVSEYPSKDAEAPSYILIHVPPAHGIRYARNLLDPTRTARWGRKVKQVLYGLLPTLSPTVRTWTYKHGITPSPENTSQGAWVLTSKRSVKLLE